jgi:type I restriction enzyme M protein
MQNAEFKISKPGTLIEVCNLIDALKISEQNQDVQGDLYEYLLSKLNTATTGTTARANGTPASGN